MLVTVSGRAVDAHSGRPLARQLVADLSSQAERSSAVIDSRGNFSFLTLLANPEETHELHFFNKALGYSTRAIHVASAQTHLDLGTMRIQQVGYVQGRLLTASGRPASGATVTAYDANGSVAKEQYPHLPAFIATTTTDENGRFALSELRNGHYKLGFSFDHTPSQGVDAHMSEPSFFWNKRGGTAIFASARTISIHGSTPHHALARFSRSVRVPHGAVVTGRVNVKQQDALYLRFLPVPAAPSSAGPIDLTTVRSIGAFGAKGVRFQSGALPPGRYRLVAPGYATNSSGQVIGDREYYYTGDGRKPTTTASRAVVITISPTTRRLKIGVFDTTE